MPWVIWIGFIVGSVRVSCGKSVLSNIQIAVMGCGYRLNKRWSLDVESEVAEDLFELKEVGMDLV